MKILFVLLLSLNAHAQSTGQWIDAQWSLLPQAERATKPAASIPIIEYDRKNLDLKATALSRNTYLNRTYRKLAEGYAACLDVPVASWYHFGYRASRTSGRFISGERFRSMGLGARAGLAVLAALGLFQSEKQIIELFGRTNFLIGVEMVPAGRLFLQTFCQAGPLPEYRVFGRHLEGGDRARQELHLAFKQYYLALSEADPVKKAMLVAYGTSLQMMGEQRRAQNNVNALFELRGLASGAVESLYRWVAASTTGLELSQGVTIPFNKNVSAQWMAPEMVSITLPGYQRLHAEHKVALNPDRGYFSGTLVKDWGNLDQRLRYLVAVVRAQSSRPELLDLSNK